MVDVKEQEEFDIIIPERKTTSKNCPFIYFSIQQKGCIF